MNFLAHLYLSGTNNQLKVGNFIGDWVKGRNLSAFPEAVQKGIMLHRHIDSFTDSHPIVKQSTDKLRADCGKYAGIIVDIFYDHFLAVNWDQHSSKSLSTFARNSYVLLLANYRILPLAVKGFIFKMILSNRLETYQTIDGIRKVLELMSKYTSLPDHSKIAIEILENEYNSFQNEFDEFFVEIKKFVENERGVQFSN